jgi:hypothetical protein
MVLVYKVRKLIALFEIFKVETELFFQHHVNDFHAIGLGSGVRISNSITTLRYYILASYLNDNQT